jgi:predicted permease
MSAIQSIYATFGASVRSVGTAMTLAAVGFYLHQRGFIDGQGKKTLALISQQVTFPLFLFTKIIYCNQDWSDEPCPDVTKSLQDVWLLLFWPINVVFCGTIVGHVVGKATKTPKQHMRSVLAACALGNTTGLPITLLTVVHANFPSTSDLGRIDPTLFLSVYLLLYPALQWGYGGWLLAPDNPKATAKSKDFELPTSTTSITETLNQNVLNNLEAAAYYDKHRHGLVSADEGMYVSEGNLRDLDTDASCETTSLITKTDSENYQSTDRSVQPEAKSLDDVPSPVPNMESTLLETMQNISSRCLQPPVIGSVTGLLIAIFPHVRGLLVDLNHRSSSAPFQWFFDGLYVVGLSAVPINMMILGCNLSSSAQSWIKRSSLSKTTFANTNFLPMPSMLGIVVGKMLLQPLVGILSVAFLQRCCLNVPDDIDGSFYLVLMIVFLCPTANNVMVMIELSGMSDGAKEGIATVIGLQYAAAPILLSVTMSIAIGLASHWS